MRAFVLLPLSAAALWSVGRVVNQDFQQPQETPDAAEPEAGETDLTFETFETAGAIAQPEVLAVPPSPLPRLSPPPAAAPLPNVAVNRAAPAVPPAPTISWDSIVARSLSASAAAQPAAAPASAAQPAAQPGIAQPAAQSDRSTAAPPPAADRPSANPPQTTPYLRPTAARVGVLPSGVLPAPPVAIAPETLPVTRITEPTDRPTPAPAAPAALPMVEAEPDAALGDRTEAAAPDTAEVAPAAAEPEQATAAPDGTELEAAGAAELDEPDAVEPDAAALDEPERSEADAAVNAATDAATDAAIEIPVILEEDADESAGVPVAAPALLVADARLAQPPTDVAIRTAPAAPARQTPPPAEPVAAQPLRTSIDPSYVLGAGDIISLTIMNVPEYSGEQQVLVDGSLNLPLIGRVPIAGMTLEQAGYALAARYSTELRNPIVTVSLLSPRPLQVAIAGEVQQPGLYTLSLTEEARFPNIVQAIQAAGGTTQAANLRQVEVRRPQPNGATQRIVVNLWNLVENGDQSQNLTLRDGDTIVLLPAETIVPTETARLAASNLTAAEARTFGVAVVGEVVRPGAYQMESSASGQPTVVQAIQMAGGVRSSANLREVQVRRPTRNGGEQVISLDFWRLLQAGDLSQDLILQQGDTVIVPTAAQMTAAEIAELTTANISPENIQINVVGEVKAPGTIQVQTSTTLNQAILAAGGLNDRASRDVELVRINPDGTLTRREIEVDLSQGIDSETNPVLRSGDVVIVDRTSTSRLLNQVGNALDAVLRFLPLF